MPSDLEILKEVGLEYFELISCDDGKAAKIWMETEEKADRAKIKGEARRRFCGRCCATRGRIAVNCNRIDPGRKPDEPVAEITSEIVLYYRNWEVLAKNDAMTGQVIYVDAGFTLK